MFLHLSVIQGGGGRAWLESLRGRGHAWCQGMRDAPTHGRGCALQGGGACMAGGGSACVAGETAIAAHDTHATGLHSS